MVYPMGGTVDGTQGDHVLLAPPFIVDAAAIDTIVERLGEAIDAAVGSAVQIARAQLWRHQARNSREGHADEVLDNAHLAPARQRCWR